MEASRPARQMPLAPPAQPGRDSAWSLHLIDYLMIAATLLVISSSLYWKIQGPLILIGFMALCIVYVAYNYTTRGIVLKSGLMIAWTVVGVVHVLLSYLGWLPGKPSLYLQEYVFRMGYFTFMLMPLTAALYVMFVVVDRNNATRSLAILGVCAAVGSAMFFYLAPPIDGHWLVEDQDLSLFGVLSTVLNYSIANISILFWWSLFYLVRNSVRGALLLSVILLVSDSAQMNVVALLVVLCWLVRNPLAIGRGIGALIIFGAPLIAIFLVAFAENLGIDPNTIHRANWWVEALWAVVKNGGFALGFGADSTTDFAVDDRFDMLGKWGSLPVHVIHNDFCYSFYSMGIIGGALFIALNLKHFAPRHAPDQGFARLGVIMFLMACVTTSVNSALVSPAILVGLCWIYAYGLFLNRGRALGPR